MMTAVIMTPRSLAMPTAVMTESSEKTMSSSRSARCTDVSDGADALDGVAFLPFQLVVNLVRGLGEEEQSADQQDQVAAGDLLPDDA